MESVAEVRGAVTFEDGVTVFEEVCGVGVEFVWIVDVAQLSAAMAARVKGPT